MENVPLSRVELGLRIAGALGIIASMALICRLAQVNNVTVALAFLLAVLIIAANWGLTEALVASVASMIAFNFFFLPPIRTLTIADPQNWVALTAFVVTAIIASHLSSSAQRQARQAGRRQQEMEQLYTLSRNLLMMDMHGPLAQEITNSIAQVFALPALAFYDRAAGRIHQAGPAETKVEGGKLRDAAVQGTMFHDPVTKTTVMPISLGGESMGSLGIEGASVSDSALHAMANLTAITLERARARDIATRAEAARESEGLKSAVLDALAHEFKTPLTSIKAAVSSMLSDSDLSPAHRELLCIVEEEMDRLNSMLTEAIQMSRIEAGELPLHRGPNRLSNIVRAQLEKLGERLEGREVKVDIPESLPRANVDPQLTGMVVWQLLSNALRYTPPGSPLSVRAAAGESELVVSVEDCGPGIAPPEQRKIFERFYRGKDQREKIPGTGMGLSIAREIVRAQHGRIWVESEPGKGARFAFSVPLAPGGPLS